MCSTCPSWAGQRSSHDEAENAGYCFGEGAGFFEWVFADEALRDFVLTGSFRAVNREGFLESLRDQGIRSEERAHEIVLRR